MRISDWSSDVCSSDRPGEPPPTLFEYLPDNALLVVDESHQTIPQIGAMSKGDHRRKITLAEYGFRLPSCIDNRPLRFAEWDLMRPQTVSVSATPGTWEMDRTQGVRSEEHTSELQSLMRISYAVFCLKKKT